VDDLLDVSRIVRDRIVLRKQPLDLVDLLRQVVDTFTHTMETRGHRFAVCLPEQPVWINGDAVRLTQVVVNLLDNATKYTKAGGHIQLAMQCLSGEIEIRVQDDGMGIAPSLLPHIFDIFQQGERTLDRSQGGLGLGLTLVRRLVELHDGRVEARSEGADKGSTFTIFLPAAALADEVEAAPSAMVEKPTRCCRVLVVDDEADVAASTAMLLRIRGCDVWTAAGGEEALELVQGVRPHVVLLDIGLSGMDGYEVARRLRSFHAGEYRPLLVAVTGYGDVHTHKMAIKAGFDRHLVKPVPARELYALMDEASAR
jgi:CheY-like chemotaxis protein